jgi:anthranilate synthase component 1
MRATGQHCEVVTDGAVVETHDGNPLDFIAAYQERIKPRSRRPAALLRRPGRLLRLRRVRAIEKRLATTTRAALGTPDILLLLSEEVAVIDNLSGRLYLIVWADPRQPEAYFRATKRLSQLRDKLSYSVSVPRVQRAANRIPSRAASPRPTT